MGLKCAPEELCHSQQMFVGERFCVTEKSRTAWSPRTKQAHAVELPKRKRGWCGDRRWWAVTARAQERKGREAASDCQVRRQVRVGEKDVDLASSVLGEKLEGIKWERGTFKRPKGNYCMWRVEDRQNRHALCKPDVLGEGKVPNGTENKLKDMAEETFLWWWNADYELGGNSRKDWHRWKLGRAGLKFTDHG